MKKYRYRHLLAGLKYLLGLILLFVFSAGFAQFYSGSQVNFGKNRIQHTTDRYWSFYRFNEFDTYYYKGGQSLAIYASSFADKQIAIIAKKLDFNPESKIRFLIFNDLSDLKETNIGLITDDDYNVGGLTHVIDNKVFIYFNGEHLDFEKQIQRGIAKVLLNEFLYGGSTSAKIKNSYLLSFPDWYVEGLISYLSDDWNTTMDNELRDGIRIDEFTKFERLTTTQQIIAGHSLWKYVEAKFGASAISNVLYMAKINHSIENGFQYVLNVSYESLLLDWKNYYSQRYQRDFDVFDLPQNAAFRKFTPKINYAQARISSDGNLLAYTTNDLGKVKVFVKNLETGRRKCVLKYGYRLAEKIDFTYPLLAWSPQSNQLNMIYEHRSTNVLVSFEYGKRRKRTRILNQFDKIHDFSFNKRGNLLAMSAIVNGQSDIYLFSLGGNSFNRLTQDGFDDYYPRFVNNDNAIVWSSNRMEDSLRNIQQISSQIAEDTIHGNRNNDLFFYDLLNPSKVLHRVTNTPLANEIYAMPVANNSFAWLSDENGIYNRYIGSFDSTISFIDTTTHYRYFTRYQAVSDYGTSILEQDYNLFATQYTEIAKVEGKTKIFIRPIPAYKDYDRVLLIKTAYMEDLWNAQRKLQERKEQLQLLQLKRLSTSDSANLLPANDKSLIKKHFKVVRLSDRQNQNSNIDIDNYSFNGKTTEIDKSSKAALEAGRQHGPADEIRSAYSSRPYNIEYNVSEIVTQVDFSYMNYSYQPFSNPQTPIYLTSGISSYLKFGIMDLLEDYRLIGGVKISPSLQNNEYFLTFSDYKNRIDKDYTFHRVLVDEYLSDRYLTHHIHEVFVKFGLPFDNIRGLRATFAYNNDVSVVKSTDLTNLAREDEMSNKAIFRLEYVYDNSRAGGLNILYGTRYKLFGEYYQPIEDFKENLIVFGFDFRKYVQIHKSFVWANRLAGSGSLGTQRLIYYLGGVDNWMYAKFNTDIQVDQNQEFAYQTLATNMRGFSQNIRNGNNFFLLNTELRFPPINYFSNVPVKSNFWNNFMIVGFFDMGTAWTGIDPFADGNSLFRKSIYRNPVEITIINQDDPIVGGYGFGLRSQVFGYYMRADWAWGIENGYVHDKAVFYFSLSLDF
jgi:Tol biopolymer transport system component